MRRSLPALATASMLTVLASCAAGPEPVPAPVAEAEPEPAPPPEPAGPPSLDPRDCIALDGVDRADGQDPDATPEQAPQVYETAVTYYQQHDYQRVIDLLLPDTDRHGVSGYELLGNAFDRLDKPACAIRAYREGLKGAPDSGSLHHTLGALLARHGKAEAALAEFEEGIRQDPGFAPNYHDAALLWAETDTPIWAMLHGEVFFLLAPRDPRVAKISALLFRLFETRVALGQTPDGKFSGSIAFTEDADPAPESPASDQRSFTRNWENSLMTAISVDVATNGVPPKLDTGVVDAWRLGLLKMWRQMLPGTPFGHPVLEYQARLMDAGHLEAYDFLFFGLARPRELKWYAGERRNELKAMATWMRENRFSLQRGMDVSAAALGGRR